jgi:hypothetical protein
MEEGREGGRSCLLSMARFLFVFVFFSRFIQENICLLNTATTTTKVTYFPSVTYLLLFVLGFSKLFVLSAGLTSTLCHFVSAVIEEPDALSPALASFGLNRDGALVSHSSPSPCLRLPFLFFFLKKMFLFFLYYVVYFILIPLFRYFAGNGLAPHVGHILLPQRPRLVCRMGRIPLSKTT